MFQARLGGGPGSSSAGMFDPRGGNGGHGMLTDHHGRGGGQQHDPLAMDHQLAMHHEHLNDKVLIKFKYSRKVLSLKVSIEQ